MKSYSKHSRLSVVWAFKRTDGTSFDISSYSIDLAYINPRGERRAFSSVLSSSGNALSWTIPEEELDVAGFYSLRLTLTKSDGKKIQANYESAFGILPADLDDDDTITIGAVQVNTETISLCTVAEYGIFDNHPTTLGTRLDNQLLQINGVKQRCTSLEGVTANISKVDGRTSVDSIYIDALATKAEVQSGLANKANASSVAMVLSKVKKVEEEAMLPIFGRAIPRGAKVGSKYFFADGYVKIRKQGWFIVAEYQRPVMVTISESWASVYDRLYIDAKDNAGHRINNEFRLLSYVKRADTYSGATASPYFIINAGKLCCVKPLPVARKVYGSVDDFFAQLGSGAIVETPHRIPEFTNYITGKDRDARLVMRKTTSLIKRWAVVTPVARRGKRSCISVRYVCHKRHNYVGNMYRMVKV